MGVLSPKFSPRPRDLSREQFLSTFGGVYEHSPWVAEAVWRDGLRERHDDVDGLAQAMATVVDAAGAKQKMQLINSHPDLAGRAAVAGELTADSTHEQAAAGIDQCSPEEFKRFQTMNTRYKQQFGFTFVMAVRHSNRHAILAAFEERLRHSPDTEFERAIAEIHKIAGFRLLAIAEGQQ